jgi:hypothetical protein
MHRKGHSCVETNSIKHHSAIVCFEKIENHQIESGFFSERHDCKNSKILALLSVKILKTTSEP